MTASLGSSLRSRLRRGLGAQGFSQAAQLFIRFAEVPLLLGFWGTQLYGEWLMLAAIPAYLALGDGGLTHTSSRDMAIRASGGDRIGALVVFRSTWVLLSIVCVGVAVLAMTGAWFIPLGNWLGFVAIDETDLKFVLLLLIVYVLAGFPLALMNGGFWCEGRYATGMLLATVTQLIEFCVMAGAVLLGGGPIEAACGLVAGRLVGCVLTQVGLWRVAPWLTYGWRGASKAELKRLIGPSFASLAFPLGNALNIQGMRLIVGLAMGPMTVAVFSATRTLSRLAMQITMITCRLLEPEIALAFGDRNQRLIRKLFNRSSQVTMWFGVLACLLLLMTGDEILKYWTHGKVTMNWGLYGLLLTAAFANAMWYTALMVPYATNRHGKVAVVYSVVYGAGAAGVGYVGCRVLGLVGGGIALVLAETVMSIIVIRTALTMTGETLIAWLTAVVPPPWFLFRVFAHRRSEL